MTQTLARAAESDHRLGRVTLRGFLYENGLSLVLLTAFVALWTGQILTGRAVYNQEQIEHGQPAVGLRQYVASGHFVEATAENWESEFLQMAAFVWLTSFLFQKGSPESNDPYEQEEVAPLTEDSPWPARRGGWVLKLYEYSLTIAFLLMFLVSFFLHAAGGTHAFNEEQIEHGQSAVSMWQFMATSQFWFESLQNWQSEFLAIGAMVLLAIFLRQQGSPESKPVQTPHSQNE
jgi:hypothetical protein